MTGGYRRISSRSHAAILDGSTTDSHPAGDSCWAMTPAEALAIAKAAEPQSPEKSDPRDPQGLKPGMRVTVQPVTDGGDPPVAGVIRSVDRNTIALTREHPACGIVAVHFPRVGYRVTIVKGS